MQIIDDSIDFAAYMRETDASAHVRPAKAYIQALKDRLRARGKQNFVYLPWGKTRDNFDFRPGEVSLWAGINGHGKSLVTNQVALSLMGQNQRVCVANFEAKPEVTMQRLARMHCGMNPFSPEFQQSEGIAALDALYEEFGEFTTERLWLYDKKGMTPTESVIGMVRYCAKELRMNHIFVDNLAKCVKGEDDYNGQKMFIDEMCAISHDYQCHIHVVHHLKKPPKETDKPDKSDVKGSGSIVDQVDNLFIVWRNKAKEDARKAGDNRKDNEPDSVVYCRKQRNYEKTGEGEPTILLWFHADAGHFVSNPGDGPMMFGAYPHEPTRISSNYEGF